MYKVVSNFRDAKDNNRLYEIGDESPAVDAPKPTKTRILELAKGKNPYGVVFIEEIEEAPENTSDIG